MDKGIDWRQLRAGAGAAALVAAPVASAEAAPVAGWSYETDVICSGSGAATAG